MTAPQRFAKPCMTNLPPDLGRAIFEQILSTPKPNFEKMSAEARRLEEEMVRVREEEERRKEGNAWKADD